MFQATTLWFFVTAALANSYGHLPWGCYRPFRHMGAEITQLHDGPCRWRDYSELITGSVDWGEDKHPGLEHSPNSKTQINSVRNKPMTGGDRLFPANY